MKKIVSFLLKWLMIFFVASVMIFLVVRMMPVTPVEQWLSAYNLPHTEENIAYITGKMGLDKPLWIQYCTWIMNFLKGDWGYSLQSHLNIREQFAAKLPISISIGISGILLSAVLALLLGYGAALKRGGICDKLSVAISVVTQSVPSFIVAIVIIYAFSVKMKLVKFFTGDGRYALTAAIVITAFYSLGSLSRVVRNAYREEMTKPYVRFAVSRGFQKERVLLLHGTRPVLISLISAVLSHFAWVFGGSAVLEFAFSIPGLSFFLVTSMKNSDYTVLQTYILVVVLWMFLVHLVLNLVLTALDVQRRGK
ncbi:MAG: ABC transporter permease [Eubacteriales bacterium]|nr:ABC transporter permease [Eubacteriales bacterium]